MAVANATGKVWYSGSANAYDASMIRSIDVPAENPTLSMRVAFNIEAGWDYAYVLGFDERRHVVDEPRGHLAGGAERRRDP